MIQVAEFKRLVNTHKGETFVIICAGSTTYFYQDSIKEFIARNRAVTIGVNNVSNIFMPYYHLWTNNKRLIDFGDDINTRSKLLIGCKVKASTKHRFNYPYCNVNYNDVDEPIKFKQNKIAGRFRTAGALAIYIAHLMGGKNIFVVGMDGYTLKYNGNQHCYGFGNTDSDNDKYEAEKDQLITGILKNIRDVGVKFNIVTPTIYNSHYSELI